MKKLILVCFSLIALSFAVKAESIKNSIRLMAKKNHVAMTYQDTKKALFYTVENIDGIVCSVYTEGQCQKRSYKPINKTLKKKPRGFRLNIEHTWPQSKGAKELPANSDMHHLFVTSKESNSKRANLPFCDVASIFWELGGSFQGIDMSSQDCFEPRDEHKGNVARAMFYFSIRYEMPLDSDQEEVLRQWHTFDPVDQRELDRNVLIKHFQGNLNPFIERPELVEQVLNF